jgi:hypothetical protein
MPMVKIYIKIADKELYFVVEGWNLTAEGLKENVVELIKEMKK